MIDSLGLHRWHCSLYIPNLHPLIPIPHPPAPPKKGPDKDLQVHAASFTAIENVAILRGLSAHEIDLLLDIFSSGENGKYVF